MLYVSETWLSQVYRGIRHQDILSASGLPPKLLHGPMVRGDSKPLRGACLVEMLIEFDGIGWTYEVCQLLPHVWSAFVCLLFGLSVDRAVNKKLAKPSHKLRFPRKSIYFAFTLVLLEFTENRKIFKFVHQKNAYLA